MAEILVRFLDQDTGDLDYDEGWASNDNKFSFITSFTGPENPSSGSGDYVSDTLKYAKENAEFRADHGGDKWAQWGGWSDEKDWHNWQSHMSMLVSHMDTLLVSTVSQVELIHQQEQTNGPIMGLD